MSTVNIELADIMVVLDKGEQYNVNIKPGESYHVNVNPADSYHVVVRQPNTVVVTDRDMFFRVTDYATMALSASYAVTSSYALRAASPFPYSGSAVITGSLQVTDGYTIGGITGSLSAPFVSSSALQSDLVNVPHQSGSISFSASLSGGILGVTAPLYPYIPTASYSAVMVDYVAERTTGLRVGQLIAGWKNNQISFTDVSNVDVGDTYDISFNAVFINQFAVINVNSLGSGSNTWTVQTLYRLFPKL